MSDRTNVVIKNFEISGYSMGIDLWDSEGCTIIYNKITNCYLRGIYLGVSANNYVINNVITDTVWDGIFITRDSDDNVVRGNVFERNAVEGIAIGWNCERTIVYENEVKNNYIGIAFGNDPSNSVVYHNNFIGNTIQATSSAIIGHVWDDGYPSGGNYWSDYVGVDVKQGPAQNLRGGDLIGDTPYVIDALNIDHYSLMTPWTPLPNTISGLKEFVQQLAYNSQIKGLNTLMPQLNIAQKLNSKGDVSGAIVTLQTFVTNVQSLTNKQITPTAQYILIKSTENVISNL
jgi:parallel beta-helix repeat protein